jgi:hypothetical protein
MKILTAAAVISMCVASLAWSSVARAQTVLTVTGDATTNSLNQTTTLGSAELRVKGNGVGTVKLTCGILGQLQGQNADGSLIFRHTLACDDHSVFVLMTHTVITVQSQCTGRPGVVGTFHEDSTLQGADGPYFGSTGTISIDGTINCGFNDMKISGSVTRP